MTRTHTRIQVVVEFDGSSYGPEWTIGAIEKQAKEEAVQGLINAFRRAKLRIQVIGNPVVKTIMVVSE